MDLEALRHKYRTLLELRGERERLEAVGVLRLEGSAQQSRQETMRRLSQSFPGALRELDRLDSGLLGARLATIEALIASRGPLPPLPLWIRVVHGFHLRALALLAVRRWLQRRPGQSAPALYAQLVEWLDEDGGGRWAAEIRGTIDLACLEGILRPPGGRLMNLAWEALAAEYGQPAEALRALVYEPESFGLDAAAGAGDASHS